MSLLSLILEYAESPPMAVVITTAAMSKTTKGVSPFWSFIAWNCSINKKMCQNLSIFICRSAAIRTRNKGFA